MIRSHWIISNSRERRLMPSSLSKPQAKLSPGVFECEPGRDECNTLKRKAVKFEKQLRNYERESHGQELLDRKFLPAQMADQLEHGSVLLPINELGQTSDTASRRRANSDRAN
jgi:hypothetical protein